LLAHTIYQALAFDSTLNEEGFGLSGTSFPMAKGDGDGEKEKQWEGVSEIVLGRKEWFDAWMEGERKCAYVSLCSCFLAYII
jgi:RAD50-interacting protein 1